MGRTGNLDFGKAFRVTLVLAVLVTGILTTQ